MLALSRAGTTSRSVLCRISYLRSPRKEAERPPRKQGTWLSFLAAKAKKGTCRIVIRRTQAAVC